MGAKHELRHILGAIPNAFRKSKHLPAGERARQLSGVPLHFVDLVALGALRVFPFDDGGAGPRVLLLHGYAGHPRSHGFLRRHLRDAGFATASLDLRDHGSVQAMGDALRDWLRDHVDPDDPIAVVAHSLGGVVTRFAIHAEDVRSRVRRIVTLGSPHEGTRIAEIVESEKASQMERDAELTAALEEQEPWHDDLPPLVCLWSRADLLMVPPEAAIADGAAARELPRVTHPGYMLRPRVWRAVVDALRDG